MFRFSLFGFPVTVEFWFLLTCFLLGGGLQPGAWGSVADLADIAIWMILAFFSILVHELGHATVGRHYGANPEIVLHAFGGVAVAHGARFNRKQDLLFVAAGPGASLALATLALLVVLYAPIPDRDIHRAFGTLAGMNYAWAVLNLLPILPLDGGQLLRTALGDRRLHITCTVGFVCAAAMAALALSQRNIFLTLLMALLAFENWRMRPR